MENKDKVFKVKVLLETDCNACDAADCPVRAKLPVEYTSLAADAADQVAAHLSLLMETLLDGDEAEWIVNTLMFFKEEDESRTAIDVLHSMFIAAGYKKAARTTLEMRAYGMTEEEVQAVGTPASRRNDIVSPVETRGLRATKPITQETGDSRATIYRYIRL